MYRGKQFNDHLVNNSLFSSTRSFLHDLDLIILEVKVSQRPTIFLRSIPFPSTGLKISPISRTLATAL